MRYVRIFYLKKCIPKVPILCLYCGNFPTCQNCWFCLWKYHVQKIHFKPHIPVEYTQLYFPFFFASVHDMPYFCKKYVRPFAWNGRTISFAETLNPVLWRTYSSWNAIKMPPCSGNYAEVFCHSSIYGESASTYTVPLYSMGGGMSSAAARFLQKNLRRTWSILMIDTFSI